MALTEVQYMLNLIDQDYMRSIQPHASSVEFRTHYQPDPIWNISRSKVAPVQIGFVYLSLPIQNKTEDFCN